MSEVNCQMCGTAIGGEVKDGTFTLRREYQEYNEDSLKDVSVCETCAHKYIVERKAKEVFQPFFDAFSREVNSMGYENDSHNVEAAVDGFIRQHRTLQSSMLNFTRLFLKKIGETAEAEPNRFTDPRNQQALEWAKKAGTVDWNQPFI